MGLRHGFRSAKRSRSLPARPFHVSTPARDPRRLLGDPDVVAARRCSRSPRDACRRFSSPRITFAIGGALGVASWVFRARRGRGAAAEAGGLGARGRRPVRLPCALLLGAAARAAGGGPARQLPLAAAHRAVLGAAAERAAARSITSPARCSVSPEPSSCSSAEAARLRAEHLPGYAAAFVAAFVWATYSVLSRRFAGVPTDAVAGFCLATAALSAVCHLAFETTVWPENAGQWLAVVALGLGPVGAAFYAWDIGVKRGDIRVLGAPPMRRRSCRPGSWCSPATRRPASRSRSRPR